MQPNRLQSTQTRWLTVLERARAGDRAAFDYLWQSVEHEVLRSTRRKIPQYLRSMMSTSDLTQDAAFEIFRGLRTFVGDSQPALLRWIRGIVENCLQRSIEHHSALCRDARLIDAAVDITLLAQRPPADLVHRYAEEINLALSILLPHEQIYLQRRLEGVTIAKIAEELQDSQANVQKWGHELIRRLREFFSGRAI